MDMDKETIAVQNDKKKKTEKIISIATSLLLALAVLFCGVVVYQIQTKRYVSIFGCSVFRIISDSMEPEIPVGALIISKETDIEKIEIGDIICFRSLESYMAGSIVTHRVVGITTKNDALALRTRGDSNNSEDGFYVTANNLVGKVIYHTKENSFITNSYAVLTSGVGFFSLIVIPVILITVVILHEYIKKIKKEISELKEKIESEATAETTPPEEILTDSLEQDSIHQNDGEPINMNDSSPVEDISATTIAEKQEAET